jgi:MraZ protein
MLLTGTFRRAIDEKQRIAIPKRFRDGLAASSSQPGMLYLAPGTDGSLTLYTEESFTRLGDQLSQASPTGQDVRAFSRLFYSQAQTVELDRQGRIRIPPELVQLAALEREAVLVGLRDYLELWDVKRWDAYVTDKQKEYDHLAERALATPPPS